MIVDGYECLWVVVDRFLGDFGWLWIAVGSCGLLWMIVEDCGCLWVVAEDFLGGCGWF